MSAKFYLPVLFFLLVRIKFSLSEDPCAPSQSECKIIAECPYIREKLKVGDRNFIKCGTDSRNLNVCCPKTVLKTRLKRSKRISEIKCEEYSSFVFERIMQHDVGIGNYFSNVTTCGIVQTPLIIGGIEAALREFPHMALLGYGSFDEPNWLCGGSIISEKYILTAAHCLNKKLKVVRLGELVINSDEDETDVENISIEKFTKHRDYNKTSNQNDIGLIKLSRDIKLNQFKRPACLSTTLDWKEEYAIATGWGHDHYSRTKGTNTLMKVRLEKFSEDECKSKFEETKSKESITYQNVVCAGSHSKERDTCSGDSGGPLQIYNSNLHCMYTVVGVTSFGVGDCGTIGIPGVYTNVAAYLDWIEENVWG